MATEGQHSRELVPEIERARAALRDFDDSAQRPYVAASLNGSAPKAWAVRDALAYLLAWLDRGQER